MVKRRENDIGQICFWNILNRFHAFCVIIFALCSIVPSDTVTQFTCIPYSQKNILNESKFAWSRILNFVSMFT